MDHIFNELNDDHETRHLFYKTVFEKTHLSLCSIRAELFPQAEKNLEIIKTIIDLEGAGEVFVNSSSFYNSTMNGMHIQKHSYLGRYLSFSALMTETMTWRQQDLQVHFHKLRPEQHQKHADTLS